MNIWDVLGLAPTQDVSAIRRAYAAAAARYNPEDHPEEFLAVRQAYEQAMAYARGQEPPAAAPERDTPPPLSQQDAPPTPPPAATGGFTLQDTLDSEQAFSSPALDRFLELYRSKQRRERKQWDLWFTSPEFLAVFHDSRFTAALRRAVEETGEEFPPPKEFQIALAVAYRFRAVVYQDRTEFALEEGAGFEGVDDILHIAILGPLVRKLQGNDLTLSAAYQDYDALCSLLRNEVWDQPVLERLGKIINQYSSTYLKEKCSGTAPHERNVVSLRLLETYFSTQALPEDAYEVLWNTFDLNTAVMGRAKIFYGRLREIAMEKAPEVCGQRERFVELRTAYSDLGSDVTAAGGADSPQSRALVDRFMAREDFGRAIRNRLFVREQVLPYWCSWFSNPYLLEKLSTIYEADPSLPYAQNVVEAIRQALLRRAEEMAAKREREQLAQLAQEEITPECCTLSHPLFLRYFLQTAFYWAEGQDRESLHALLEAEFPSNDVWNRRLSQAGLSRSIPLTQYGTDENGQSVENTLEVQLCFHQFYVEYRIDGQELCNPPLPFWGLSQLEDDEVFLLLLPILSAYQEEWEDVAAHIQQRLARLGLPSDLIRPVAQALAGEAACLVPTEGGTAILRPARFYRESEEELYCCLWYGNGRLLTFRRTGQDLRIQHEFCQDNITSLNKAQRIAEKIFDEVFSPVRGLSQLSTRRCTRLHVERSGMPNQDFEGENITPELLEQVFLDFRKKYVTCVVVNEELVLLWSQRSFVPPSEPATCALLRFRDASQAWDALLSDWECYCYTDSELVSYIPFRTGSLPEYAVHRTPKKPIDALIGLLNGIEGGNGQWSNKVYRNNSAHHYYFVKRTVGAFPMEEVCGGPLLRRRYVLPKPPRRFSYREPGGILSTQEVNPATRLTLGDLLVRFEMGKLDDLSLSWELEELGTVHLVLLHEQVEGEHRDLVVLIQDDKQMILYLVADQQEYIDRENKVPKAQFQGCMIPRYLIHYNFARVRDFLDLFFLSLPRPEPLLNNNFEAMALGPKHLTKLGFEEHRRKLLEPQERRQTADRLSAQETHTAANTPGSLLEAGAGENAAEHQAPPEQAGMAGAELPLQTENAGATEEQITALEKRFHVKLPDDLKEFYKKHNGVSFPSGVQLDSESCELRYFHPIGQQYQEHILTIDKLLEWQEMDGFIPMCYVPICSDEADDSYYVRVDEEGYGKIYYIFSECLDDFLADPQGEGLIANSFAEFLGKLHFSTGN